MLKSTSTSLILLGILAVIVGVLAIAWPGVTILALVIMFAVYAFLDAGLQAAQAFSSRNAGSAGKGGVGSRGGLLRDRRGFGGVERRPCRDRAGVQTVLTLAG